MKKIRIILISLLIIFLPFFVEWVLYCFYIKDIPTKNCMSYIKAGFNVIREYKEFYATVLTLILGIITFQKQQEEIVEERKRSNDLIDRELEKDKDFYRPQFLVDSEKVRVVMKAPHLYLEDIRYYESKFGSPLCGEYIKYRTVQSEQFVYKCRKNDFFITARTQRGEIILYRYYSESSINNSIYKFLKNEENYLLSEFKYLDSNNQEEVNQVWGSYNTIYNNENEKELFLLSTSIRMLIHPFFSQYHYDSLNSQSLECFFKNIFLEFKNNDYCKEKKHIIYVILKNYVNYIFIIKDELAINCYLRNDAYFYSMDCLLESYFKLKNNINSIFPKLTKELGTEDIYDIIDNATFITQKEVEVNDPHNSTYLKKYLESEQKIMLDRYCRRENTVEQGLPTTINGGNTLNVKKFVEKLKEYLDDNEEIDDDILEGILNMLSLFFEIVQYNLFIDDEKALKEYIKQVNILKSCLIDLVIKK